VKNLSLPFGYADKERLEVYLIKHGLVLLAYIEYDNGAFLRTVSSLVKNVVLTKKIKVRTNGR
jgi:hypothetical protein